MIDRHSEETNHKGNYNNNLRLGQSQIVYKLNTKISYKMSWYYEICTDWTEMTFKNENISIKTLHTCVLLIVNIK